MTTIDGNSIQSGTSIDGTEVQEITVDGDVVFTAVQVIEDMEYLSSGSVSDRFQDDTGGFAATTSNALEGSYALEGTDQYNRVTYTEHTMTDRTAEAEYVLRIESPSGGEGSFAVNSQVYDAIDDSYWVQPWNNFECYVREGGSTSTTYSHPDNYEPPFDQAIDFRVHYDGSGTITLAAHEISGDSIGSELASYSFTDSTHSGGLFGYYNSESTAYYDHVRKTI